MMFFEATVLSTASEAIAHSIMAGRQTIPEPHEVENVNAAYEILDKYLQKTKFVACDNLTIADMSCLASVSSIAVLVPVDDKYTKLKAWFNILKEDDWYKK